MKQKSRVNPKMVEEQKQYSEMDYTQWRDEIELSLDIEKQVF